MANLFHSPAFIASDINGASINGSKLFFYESGTTNPANTFTDNALSVVHANPVVADSAGRFAAIYLQAIEYKVVWTDADDVTIKTWDPVHGTLDTTGDDFAASQQSPADMTVLVATGSLYDMAGKAIVSKAAQTSNVITAPSANPRKDIIHINRITGVIGVTTGSEAASPTDPTLGDGLLPIARVTLATTTTEITDSLITDVRELDQLGWGETDGGLILSDTNVGAGEGPLLILDRNSASPAVSDALGAVMFRGRNDAAAAVDYAEIRADITDETGLTEDGFLRFLTTRGGSLGERVRVADGVQVGTPAGGDKGTGTLNATGLYVNSISAVGVLETEQATTSGTTVDFTGIASGVTRITVQLAGVSTDGTSGIQVVLGDSGGFETSGYSGVVARLAAAAVSVVVLSTGFDISDPSAWAAGDAVYGTVTLTLEDSANFNWVASVNIGGVTVNDFVASGGGIKSLSGVLTQVRLKTTNGSDVFDAGAVNILVE